MKRIPNKTAIMTICFGINTIQEIAIYDYESGFDMMHRKNGKLVCKGKLGDLMYDYRLSKYFESEYHSMVIEDGTIVFNIFTKYEQYKA